MLAYLWLFYGSNRALLHIPNGTARNHGGERRGVGGGEHACRKLVDEIEGARLAAAAAVAVSSSL